MHDAPQGRESLRPIEAPAEALAEHRRQVYAPPEAELEKRIEFDPGDALLAAFVGPRWPRYAREWQTAQRRRGLLQGFHWPAFLFGSLWLLYRKMYFAGVVLIAGSQLATQLLGRPQLEGPGRALWMVLLLVLAGALGSLAYPGYHAFCRRKLGRIEAEVLDPERRLAEASRAGGTSVLAVALGILVLIGLGFVSSPMQG